MMSMFQKELIRGDGMQVYNEESWLANNSLISDTDEPRFAHMSDKYFELFVEEYIRENLHDLLEDVLCGAI